MTKDPTTNRQSSLARRHQGSLLLWGLPLAPLPPKASLQGKRHIEGRRGMALIMVLTLLALTTTVVMELQFDTRVQLQMAANSRNALQAEYLAHSSLQFTHLLLSFNTQFNKAKQQFQKFLAAAPPEMKMLLNKLQIWKVVPINSDLIKQIATGGFGRAASEKTDSQEGKGKLYPFGDFLGRFSANLEDESAKINLNRFFDMQDGQALKVQLMALFAPERYNPLFEMRRADGNFVTREEQIAAIQDWVDANNNVEGQSASDEDSKYRYPEKGYHSKNDYFDSLEELRLIYGIDDIFFETFAKYFTVYGPRLQINISNAPKEVLAALVEAYAIVPLQERFIFRTPQFLQFVEVLAVYRDYLGFASIDEFVNWCDFPIDPRAFGATMPNNQMTMQGKLSTFKLNKTKMLRDGVMVDTATFRVDAMGQVGTIQRTITAIIYAKEGGQRTMLYWRLR